MCDIINIPENSRLEGMANGESDSGAGGGGGGGTSGRASGTASSGGAAITTSGDKYFVVKNERHLRIRGLLLFSNMDGAATETSSRRVDGPAAVAVPRRCALHPLWLAALVAVIAAVLWRVAFPARGFGRL